MADRRQGNRSIWKNRGRRVATGLNVILSLILATAAVLIVDVMASRHYARWDISRQRYYQLSDKSQQLLLSLKGQVQVVVFFQHGQRHFEDVKALLKEYEYAASRSQALALNVEFVDPDRDLSRVRALASDYDVEDPNVVVFDCEGRRQYVELSDIVTYETRVEQGHIVKELVSFHGEQAFSSAIHAVVQPEKPVIYFLAGHGERGISDYSPAAGFSAAARALRRDNLEVRSLIPAAVGGIPADCDVLVVAGPSKQLSREEVELVADYLNRNGRALFLLDPYSRSGLDGLLERWGVRVAEEVVVGMTLTGRELVVSNYGDHPITRNLRNVQTMFYLPRMLQPVAALNGGAHQVDRPTVTILASNSEKGWAEADPETRPPHFDEAADQRGPVPLALAVERGTVAGLDVEIKPTRLVVIGDSYFVSNGSLKAGVGGNIDFFMSSVNWLLEREELMAISARDPQRVELGLDRHLVQLLFLLSVVGVPGLVALTGGLIWWKRRR
ncbi:MAG: GldG family protein [Lentisphaerae bacterium]|nr:GldG family protein [Lentisphaerota bacterium]